MTDKNQAEPLVRSYPVEPRMQQQIDECFTYHPPKPDQVGRYVDLRAAGRELALLIARSSPPSRAQSVALTKLEESIMWANAAIARGE